MRIISGLFKGRGLTAPNGLTIRPTPDKVKGAIFNIIGERIIESSFLDLFAGTGAIGIEALSRGAREVIFVDNSIKAINIIKENLQKIYDLRFTIYDLKSYAPKSKISIIKGDAVEFIKKTGQQFDFIFLDPPYKSDLGEGALIEISRRNILKENGEVIWEHYYKTEYRRQNTEDRIKLKRTVRYGDTSLSFYNLSTDHCSLNILL